MSRRPEQGETRLDDAARAGWLYYVAGNTQDEIARKLGVSRQTAQRLVSLAISERLIKVRLDHPIAQCLELAKRLTDRFAFQLCEVVPSDPTSPSTTLGIAEAAAAEMERRFSSSVPGIMALGTGRTLRAAIERLPKMECPQHKIVSMLGNIAPDGSASFYDVVMRIADTVRAPHYQMPLPVFAGSVEEKQLLLGQKPVRHIVALAKAADVTFVGVGSLRTSVALLEDGFITADELDQLVTAGAVGEIVGWAFDPGGCLISGLTNARLASVPLEQPARRLIIGVAMGAGKIDAIRAAITGKLLNGLVTDESTARRLLA